MRENGNQPESSKEAPTRMKMVAAAEEIITNLKQGTITKSQANQAVIETAKTRGYYYPLFSIIYENELNRTLYGKG
jgi:uncharacterized protein (DUF427 family)